MLEKRLRSKKSEGVSVDSWSLFRKYKVAAKGESISYFNIAACVNIYVVFVISFVSIIYLLGTSD